MEQNKNSEIDPLIYHHLIFSRCTKAILWERKINLINGVRPTRCTHEKINPEPYLNTKNSKKKNNNSRWLMDLNQTRAINLLKNFVFSK